MSCVQPEEFANLRISLPRGREAFRDALSTCFMRFYGLGLHCRGYSRALGGKCQPVASATSTTPETTISRRSQTF